MLVSELMSPHVISVLPDESASAAARLLDRHNIGALPVCTEDGCLRGIVTDRDIVLRCVAAESAPEETRVREIMSRGVIGVAPGEDVREATRLMAERRVRRLPVVVDGRVVGMLALGDMARHHRFDMEASKALSEISAASRAH
ncbi:MAG: CBS domain-containing protein [Oscillospiraceae bacterium]|jgi:CBS domain-containing protein|nr:CBS domain-containing protein [Oscillospiraceae bacterium]